MRSSASPSPDDGQQIGTLNEKPLHAALKSWYAEADDDHEAAVDGYVIDIIHGELLVEIQTRNFSAIKRKMNRLTRNHAVRLVYPVAQKKWIVKLAPEKGGIQSRRKSPKRGSVAQLFEELVSFPKLLARPGFSLEVLLIEEEEIRRFDGRKGWRRRGWVTDERRLLRVIDRHLYETPADLLTLLPADMPEPFSTADLAAACGIRRRLAQRMAYCLREMNAINTVGKKGNALLYRRDLS